MRAKSANADATHEDPAVLAPLYPEFPPTAGEALIDGSGTSGLAFRNNRVWSGLGSAPVCHVLACLATIDAPSQGHKGALTDWTYRVAGRDRLDLKLFHLSDRENRPWMSYRRAIVARRGIDIQLGPPPVDILDVELAKAPSIVSWPSRCALAASGLV